MNRDELEAAFRTRLAGAAPVGTAVLFDLGADGTIFLDGRSDPPVVAPAGTSPDATITVTASDLGEMLSGQLSPMEAYSLGRLEVDGDISAAMKLGSLLR